MLRYSVYTLTSDNLIMGAGTVLDCETDQGAIEKARILMNGDDIEVWQGARRITRIRSTDAR